MNSILLQASAGECTVIISNNGGNQKVRDIFTSKEYLKKVQYMESPRFLSMSEHFEWASSLATSEYMMVLPARRMLRQGAISKMIKIMDNNPDCEICCGEWDNESNRLFSNHSSNNDRVIETKELIDKFLHGTYTSCYEFWSSHPTAMNGIVRTDFVNKLRGLYLSNYFGEIAPDVSSGFKCLLNSRLIYLIGSPIFITTNRAVSTGNESILYFNNEYFNELGERGIFRHVSAELNGSIYASIIEDYNRQKQAFALLNNILCKSNEVSNFFLREIAFEFYLKLFNNPVKIANIKRIYSASKVLLKSNVSYSCLMRKFMLAIIATIYLRSPKFVKKNIFSIFRGESKSYKNAYIAAGFVSESVDESS